RTLFAWAGDVVAVTLFASAGRSAGGAAAISACASPATLTCSGCSGCAGWLGAAEAGAAGSGAGDAVFGACLAVLSFSFISFGFTTSSRSMVILTNFFLGVMFTRSTALVGSS